MSSDDDRWMDWDSGPVARPYTLTGGRTRPRGERHFDLIEIVARCFDPIAVADLASALGLPLGVVRVLLDDLVHEGLIEVRVAAPRGRMSDRRVLKQVLD